MASYDVYSQLTNELFYVKVGKDESERGIYSHEESILYKTNYNDKVIIILHELYINTNFRRQCLITLDYLIEKCGYKVDKDNRRNFKNTLEKLKELKIINFDSINKSNELIEIDTEELVLQSKNYTQISDEEMAKFNSVTDVRTKTTLLKLYLYLKARVTKRSNNETTGDTNDIGSEFVPQTTYQAYDTINKYTNISTSRIKEYIDQLQAMNLITYVNVGKKYKANDIQQKLTECPNVYAINCLQSDVQAELEIGVKRCINNQQENGYIVCKKNYKNNNRQMNGKKGSLIKKKNNNNITEEELKELDNIIAMQNEYKEEYNNFTPLAKEETKHIGIKNRKSDIWGESPKEIIEEEYIDKEYEDYIDSLL